MTPHRVRMMIARIVGTHSLPQWLRRDPLSKKITIKERMRNTGTVRGSVMVDIDE